MNIIKRISKYREQLYWLIFTGCASFLPTILRLLVSTYYDIHPFDIKDVLFAGIAFNLANFSMVSVKEFPDKRQIISISAFLLIIIVAILMLYLVDESNKEVKFHLVPFLLGLSLSLTSGIYCFQVNDLVIKTQG